MCTTAPEPPSSRARELRTPVPILEMDPNCDAGGSELVTFCQKASVEPRKRVVQTLRDCVTCTASVAPLIKILPRKIICTQTASHPREEAATAYGTARPRQLDIATTSWHLTTSLLQLHPQNFQKRKSHPHTLRKGARNYSKPRRAASP